jgi:hypothetical protein
MQHERIAWVSDDARTILATTLDRMSAAFYSMAMAF